jgi:phage shock protein PspC (stress-responsive transcriptional regulator)
MSMSEDNEFSRYYCSPEWHLARLTHTPFAGPLYSFMLRVSKGSGWFHGSAEGVAQYFGVSRWTIQRAMQALVDLGFLVRVAQAPYTPSVYRVIAHNEWEDNHPGCCAKKETLPWSEEKGDPLGVRLWNVSGGKVKYQPYQLTALRKTGLTDDQIATAFEEFVTAEQARCEEDGSHVHWGKVQFRFRRWIIGRTSSDELEKLGLEPSRA